MPNSDQPTLAVVVPATDRPPTLERCLAALRASSDRPDELVVVAAPAADGPAAARNRGARATSAELIAFVDADVAVEPGALGRLRARFAADPELAAAFGAYDDHPTAPGAVSGFRNLLHHHVHSGSPGPAETFWAGLGAVRRSDFEAAGGFDAQRFERASVEDIELGMRMRRAGAAIVLDPAIRGTHLKRWTLASMVATDLRRRGVPWTRLQLEAGELSSALNLGWRQRLSALAAVVAAGAALTRRPRLALAAAGSVIALDPGLYALLRRRGGTALALAGWPLHLLHHLTAACAAAIAVVAHLGRRGR